MRKPAGSIELSPEEAALKLYIRRRLSWLKQPRNKCFAAQFRQCVIPESQAELDAEQAVRKLLVKRNRLIRRSEHQISILKIIQGRQKTNVQTREEIFFLHASGHMLKKHDEPHSYILLQNENGVWKVSEHYNCSS